MINQTAIKASNFIWSIYILIMIDTLLLRPSLYFTQLHFAPLHYICRHFIFSHLKFTQLHFTPLRYTCWHFIFPFKLHITTLHSTSLHLLTLHFFPFRGVSLRPLACWDCGFESRRWHRHLSHVGVVCCKASDIGEWPIPRSGESYPVYVWHLVDSGV